MCTVCVCLFVMVKKHKKLVGSNFVLKHKHTNRQSSEEEEEEENELNNKETTLKRI